MIPPHPYTLTPFSLSLPQLLLSALLLISPPAAPGVLSLRLTPDLQEWCGPEELRAVRAADGSHSAAGVRLEMVSLGVS